MPIEAPQIAAIEAAARRLDGLAVYTPLLENSVLNEALGFRLLIKPECLQRTGSFKFRGAYNRISLISEDARAKGVVAFSSGNHAQGVAAAAQLFGMSATIIMPKDAPKPKIDNTRALGAEVVLYDRYSESREELGQHIRDETGATLVKPYDDPGVIAGQGTVGLEIAAQCRARDINPDIVAVPCGGGGLIAGVSTALHAKSPETRIIGVEPNAFDDTVRSLKSGVRETNDADARSICDALLTPAPGEITFEINRRLLSGCVSVSDAEAMKAMKTAMQSFKIAVEPGGAVALAALLEGRIDVRGGVAVAVCSGGNVAPEMLAQALSG